MRTRYKIHTKKARPSTQRYRIAKLEHSSIRARRHHPTIRKSTVWLCAYMHNNRFYRCFLHFYAPDFRINPTFFEIKNTHCKSIIFVLYTTKSHFFNKNIRKTLKKTRSKLNYPLFSILHAIYSIFFHYMQKLDIFALFLKNTQDNHPHMHPYKN